MANLSDRLVQLRKEAGLNRTGFAEKIGIPPTTLRNYELGTREPGHGYIARMAKMFGTSADYILGLSDERHPQRPECLDIETASQWGEPILTAYAAAIRPTQEAACAVLGIPHVSPGGDARPQKQSMLIYDFPAAAGLPLFAEDSYERVDFGQGDIPGGADFGIRICGASMEPTIADGSIVFLHKQPELQNGQIGIFMIDDSAACKRFYKHGDQITLKSDNPAHEDILIQPYQAFYVVGRVLGYR